MAQFDQRLHDQKSGLMKLFNLENTNRTLWLTPNQVYDKSYVPSHIHRQSEVVQLGNKIIPLPLLHGTFKAMYSTNKNDDTNFRVDNYESGSFSIIPPTELSHYEEPTYGILQDNTSQSQRYQVSLTSKSVQVPEAETQIKLDMKGDSCNLPVVIENQEQDYNRSNTKQKSSFTILETGKSSEIFKTKKIDESNEFGEIKRVDSVCNLRSSHSIESQNIIKDTFESDREIKCLFSPSKKSLEFQAEKESVAIKLPAQPRLRSKENLLNPPEYKKDKLFQVSSQVTPQEPNLNSLGVTQCNEITPIVTQYNPPQTQNQSSVKRCPIHLKRIQKHRSTLSSIPELEIHDLPAPQTREDRWPILGPQKVTHICVVKPDENLNVREQIEDPQLIGSTSIHTRTSTEPLNLADTNKHFEIANYIETGEDPQQPEAFVEDDDEFEDANNNPPYDEQGTQETNVAGGEQVGPGPGSDPPDHDDPPPDDNRGGGGGGGPNTPPFLQKFEKDCEECDVYLIKCCKYETTVENLCLYSSVLENQCTGYKNRLKAYCTKLAASKIIIKHLQEKNNQLIQKWTAIQAEYDESYNVEEIVEH